MYESFYHLEEQPFGSTPDPKYLYKSAGHRNALAYLANGIYRKKGFLALIGEVGVGKTTIIRSFVHAMQPTLDMAFVLNSKLSFDELLYLILHDFGVEAESTSKVRMLTKLNEVLVERFAANKNPVIVIDEAQNLTGDVLEEIRMLSNLETNDQKLVQIVLVGQPELDVMLRRRELRQLKQRIAGIHRMQTLLPGEIVQYVEFRLRTAGLPEGGLEFTTDAYRTLWDCTGGVPRLINLICDRALGLGHVRKTHRITRELVTASARELLGPEAVRDTDWKISG